MADYKFPQVGHISLSVGFARIAPDPLLTTTVDEANRAVYFVKEYGKDQARCYETLIQAGLVKPQDLPSRPIDIF